MNDVSLWDDDPGYHNVKKKHTRNRKLPSSHKRQMQDTGSLRSTASETTLYGDDKKKQIMRNRFRKKHCKYQNCIDSVESSDESVTNNHNSRSRSNSIIFNSQSPKGKMVVLNQLSDSLQFQAISSETKKVVGSPHHMQHSPYYRALFGTSEVSKTGVMQSQQVVDGVLDQSTCRRDRANSYIDNFDLESTLTTADGSSEEEHRDVNCESIHALLPGTNLFGGDNCDLHDDIIERHQIENTKAEAGTWNMEPIAIVNNELFWPALPKKVNNQHAYVQVGAVNSTPTPMSSSMRSPNRSNIKTNNTKVLSGIDMRRLLSSPKYKKPSSVLRSKKDVPSPDDSALKTTTPQHGSVALSPRRLRFPEPKVDKVFGSPSALLYKVMPAPLFATLDERSSQKDDVYRTLDGSPFTVHCSLSSSLTPKRHNIMSVALSDSKHNQSPDMLSISLAQPSPLARETSGSMHFNQSLTPGLLSPVPSIVGGHHHISFARYLAMTSSVGGGGGLSSPSLTRVSTYDTLQVLTKDLSDDALMHSCYSDLDPLCVVRVLYDTYFGKSTTAASNNNGGGQYNMLQHSMRSISVGLNLSLMDGAAALPPRTNKRWDDPDSESDEESDAAGDASTSLSGLFESVAAKTYDKCLRSSSFDGHAAYLQSVLVRCSYFRTVTTEKRQPVDASWFYSQIYPAYYMPQASKEVHLERLTVDKVFSGYVNFKRFLFHIAGGLCHEDDRVASPRLAVLKAFYLLPSEGTSAGKRFLELAGFNRTVRETVLRSLEQCSLSRLERCRESAVMSISYEVDTNYIARRGFLDCCAPMNDMNLVQNAVLTGCDISSVCKGADERPAYKTRDNDSSLQELLKFIISCEIKEISTVLEEELPSRMCKADLENIRSCFNRCGHRLVTCLGVFLNMFRCYGSKLGNSSELVEQSDLLNSLVEILEGMLLWTHALSAAFSYIQTLPAAQSDTGMRLSGEKQVSTEPFINTVCRHLLQRFLGYWTATSRNFGQDIAFLRVCELMLVVYTPLTRQAIRDDEEVRTEKEIVILPKLQKPCAADTVVIRCLTKFVSMLKSQHFKVAVQALTSLQNPVITYKYFLPSCNRATKHVTFKPAQSGCCCPDVVSDGSLGAPLSDGRYVVGLTEERREDLLTALVDALRGCRAHWHPAIQQSSAVALDSLLERLQEAEDLVADSDYNCDENGNSDDEGNGGSGSDYEFFGVET